MLYLLHFSPPYKHAKHYLGWAPDNGLLRRIAAHRAGKGACLTRHAVAAGCRLILVETWPGDRNDERALKKRHNAPRLCPLCNQPEQPLLDLLLDFTLDDVAPLAF